MIKDRQIIFEVSPNLKRRVKEKLVREGLTFKEIGNQFFSDYLKQNSREEQNNEKGF